MKETGNKSLYTCALIYIHLFPSILHVTTYTPHSSLGCHMISGDKSSLKTKEEWLLSWDVVCGWVFLFCVLFFLILTFSLESFFHETNKNLLMLNNFLLWKDGYEEGGGRTGTMKNNGLSILACVREKERVLFEYVKSILLL